MTKEVLLIILCIIGYIAIGICAAMIEIYYEVKSYGEMDKEDKCYIGIGLFWPLAAVFCIIAYPFSKIGQFLEWFGKKLEEGEVKE